MSLLVRAGAGDERVGDLVKAALAALGDCKGASELRADQSTGVYSLASLELLSEYLSKHAGGKETLADYLTPGASLVFPNAPPKAAEPSEELVKRREYLKLKQEAREYNRMVYGREEDPRVAEILDAGNHMSSAKNQLAISANMVISVLASFAIAYYAGKSFKASTTTCLVCGLLGAMAILLVEMTLFIVRAMRYENISSKDAAQIARKQEAALKAGGLAPNAVYSSSSSSAAAAAGPAAGAIKDAGSKKRD